MFRSAHTRTASADNLPKTPPTASEIRRLLRYVRPYKCRCSVASVGLLGGAALGLVFPWIMQNLVDAVLGQHNLAELNRITLILIGTFLVRGVFYYIQNYALAYVGERIVVDMRREVYSPPARPDPALLQRPARGRAGVAAVVRRDAGADGADQQRGPGAQPGAHLSRLAGADAGAQLAADAVHPGAGPAGGGSRRAVWAAAAPALDRGAGPSGRRHRHGRGSAERRAGGQGLHPRRLRGPAATASRWSGRSARPWR